MEISEEKYNHLLTENQILKDILKRHGIFYLEPGSSLSGSEKLSVFMDYFHGNNTVYAYRYIRKDGSTGWNPSCTNSGQYGICPHRSGQKMKCSKCAHFIPIPLNIAILKEHFKNPENNGIGIYPLQTDSTTFLLAIDFDEDHWFENMKAVAHCAKQHGIFPVMERSSSGNGGHLWFFFVHAIPAAKARKMGEFLLEEGMKSCRDLNFSSFDRMFPNQDFMPEGGFGNLIALPYRYSAFQNGNSIFIDEQEMAISHPIEYLASIEKITDEALSAVLSSVDNDYFFSGDQLTLPLDTNMKYIKEIHAVRSNMLIIEKKGLNAVTVNILKRSASMFNPEYYAKQKRHLQIYHKATPRVLSWFEEDDSHLFLPRGVEEKICQKMPETLFTIKDERSEGSFIDVSFKGILKDEQNVAVHSLLKHDMGVLMADAGYGKTVAGIYIIAKLQVSTLIIVHTSDLQRQWIQRLKQFLDYPGCEKKRDRFIGRFDGNSKCLRGNIDVAISASLIRAKNMKEISARYGLILVDECHHAASTTFTEILKNCVSKRIYGFSATPERKDQLTPVIYMFCGPIRFKSSQYAGYRKQNFRKILIPRFTNSVILSENSNFTEMLDFLTEDKIRNQLIFKDISRAYQQYRKILVLSDRIEHLQKLKTMLEYISDAVYLLTGKTKRKEQEEIVKQLNVFDRQDRYILLATCQLVGEGFDLQSLDTLFLTTPISGSSRIIQYTGRIHREYDGKEDVCVYDYVDQQIPIAKSMYHKRLIQYKKMNYITEEKTTDSAIDQILYNSDNFEKVLKQDISAASKEIIIFTEKPSLTVVKQYHNMLSDQYHRGIQLFYIVNNGVCDEIKKYLKGNGGTIIEKKHRMHTIIIDRQIVWDSSFDFLSQSQKEDYCTRNSSPSLASEIIIGIHSLSNKIDEIPYNLFTVNDEKETTEDN